MEDNNRSAKGFANEADQDLVQLTTSSADFRLAKGFDLANDDDSFSPKPEICLLKEDSLDYLKDSNKIPDPIDEDQEPGEECCLHDNPFDYFGTPEEGRELIFQS